MKKEDILINVAITIFVSIASPLIISRFTSDPILSFIITILIILFFWFGSYLKGIENRTKRNFKQIIEIKRDVNGLKEDLNIEKRLSKLEEWKDNMKKRGQINIVDLIKIIAILLIIYLFLKTFNLL